jgi:hypothetical protein
VALTQLAQRLSRNGVTPLLAGVTPDNRHGRALSAFVTTPQAAPWQAHADADHAIEAAERLLLFELPHAALQGLQASDPEIATHLYRNLARHLPDGCAAPRRPGGARPVERGAERALDTATRRL